MARVALVTVAARGIGQAIARDLAHDHAVAITWRSTEPRDLPEGVLALQADLTLPGSAEAVVAAVIARFGRLDVIVNNAGLVHPSPTEEAPAEAVQEMLGINLLSPHALLAAALPHLEPGAAIVNISSMNARLPPRGAALYGASKPLSGVSREGFARMGVARISLGAALARLTHRAIVEAGRAALAGDFTPLAAGMPGAEVDRLLGG
jgi:NAD(P)-dependent dehydrogenase (short-subunit alcohol dehydrogenase family)